MLVYLSAGPFSETSPSPQTPRPNEALTVGVTEVLLDIVATDRKGRQIKDLKAEDFEIQEEGVKQKITSFRLVEPEDVLSGGSAAPVPGAPPAPLDPLRQIRLVTLAFDQLGLEGRNLARQAALDFLDTELRQNVYVAVFKIDLRLTILQQFTNNRDLLRRAVDLATTGTFNQFEVQSEAIQQTLQRMTAAQAAADAAASSAAGPGGANTATIGSSAADAQMAQMQLTMLRYSETMTREQQGRSSIFSLMSLAKEQRLLPGRKTMIYFSEGIQVPSNLKPHWDTLMSLANRSNVSIYSVDARGLNSGREGLAGSADLASAAAQSQRQMATRGSGPVSRADVMIGEQAEEAIRKNVQGTLAELAENTGGFLIANSNDLRIGMRKVANEVASYYALSYTPTNPSYDGKFRKISVKVNRGGVKLQTRNGYFALPPTNGVPVLSFELPMLSALGAKAMPVDLDFREASLVYPTKGSNSEVVVYFEIPLTDFSFSIDNKKKEYEANISAMAVLKDQAGEIVQKLSQQFPLRGPKNKALDTQSRNILFYRTLSLSPGRYTLETVIRDGISEKMTVKRSVLIIPPHDSKAAALSTVTLVKRLDDAHTDSDLAKSPLNFRQQMVIPNLRSEINPKESPDLLFYFVAVVPPGGSSKSIMDMIVSKDGQAIGRLGETELPAADQDGRIPYLAKLPLSAFSPGTYDISVVVNHAGATTNKSINFKIQ